MNNTETSLPPTGEEFYQWKEFGVVDGEDKPRLLTPWSDPMKYEFPMDWMFPSVEKAKEAKSHMGSNDNWWLVRVTYEPVEMVKAEGPEEPE